MPPVFWHGALSGPQYVWKGFGFPEESDEKVEALYRLAVEQGSAIGMLVAIRSGVLSVGLERKAPSPCRKPLTGF